MEENTRKILQASFRPEQIKQRQGSFGKVLSYVEGSAVIERLNLAFSQDWSFEILKADINHDAGEVLAHVRISAAGLIKEGYGSSQIKRQRDSAEIIDLGNDVKAACTDALKKAATLFGVGLSLYHDPDAAPEQKEAVPEHSAAQPRQSSSKTQGQQTHGSDSRLSSKQHAYLLKLASAQGLTKQDLNQQCQHRYGVMLDFMSRQAASALIDQLQHGEIPSSGNAA